MALLDQCSWAEVRRGVVAEKGRERCPGGAGYRCLVDVPGEVKVGVTFVSEEEHYLSQLLLSICVSPGGDADARFYTDYLREGIL